ncbi:MAG: tRNA (adenosine(37)-N6)-dimethylallyltransferase MiaA [Planctomycetaceae bacterium]|jgi:tRNA dimethylallyltransferase
MNFPAELLKQCWFMTGPTAVGKSAAALLLAERLNAEILSLDSMAVYRGMDIGTAKPEKSELAAVRHHLIDLADPHQDFTIAEYLDAALAAAQDVTRRGRLPLFVGGTGLYLRAVLRGLFEGPPADRNLRCRLERQARQHGPQYLYDQLVGVDPPTAARLHVNDQRRVIRALEVHAITGVPISEQHHNVVRPGAEQPEAVFWLHAPRDWLRDRINRRVDRMMQRGLLDEAQMLLNAESAPGRTARQALGYRELFAHLENGQPLDECVELIKVRTRQFAKRQHTWFRNLEECRCLSVSGDELPDQLADRLCQEFRRCDLN